MGGKEALVERGKGKAAPEGRAKEKVPEVKKVMEEKERGKEALVERGKGKAAPVEREKEKEREKESQEPWLSSWIERERQHRWKGKRKRKGKRKVKSLG